jgi:hypothetical protein
MTEAAICPACKCQPFERDAVGISDDAQSFELVHEFPAGSYTVCINCKAVLTAAAHNELREITDEEFINLDSKPRRTLRDMQTIIGQYHEVRDAKKAGKPKPQMSAEVAQAFENLHNSLGRIAAIFGAAGQIAEAMEGMTQAALYSALKSAADMKDRPSYRRALIAVLEAEIQSRGQHDVASAAPAPGAR